MNGQATARPCRAGVSSAASWAGPFDAAARQLDETNRSGLRDVSRLTSSTEPGWWSLTQTRPFLIRGVVAAAAVVAVGAPAIPRAQAATAADLAQAAYNRMSNAQRIGQLLMSGTPTTGLSAAAATAIGAYHVGNAILTGRSTAGAAPIRALTARLDRLATGTVTAGVPLWISTDQEGGYVQVPQGAGFSRMPTAPDHGHLVDDHPDRLGAHVGWAAA